MTLLVVCCYCGSCSEGAILTDFQAFEIIDNTQVLLEGGPFCSHQPMQWDQQIFVAKLNVEHFRMRLEGDLDDAQRRTISGLLAEEEAKLVRLKAAAAERDLSALIDLLAQRAGVLFDGASPHIVESFHTRLSATIAQVPVGMGLADGDGKLVLANDRMRRFIPSDIPSRDPERLRRWRFETSDGPLSPFRWPGAQALRGQPVNPGIESIFINDDGEQTAVRVAAVPVRDGAARVSGVITAIYELETLSSDDALQRIAMLVAEEMGKLPPNGDAADTR